MDFRTKGFFPYSCMGIIKALFAAGVGALAFVIAESIREYRNFRVTHYDLKTPFMEPGSTEKKIVFLSDLHNRVYGDDNQGLLESIRKEQPDLILVGGDMLISKMSFSDMPAREFVSCLPEIAPVYYALGNHEQRRKEKRYHESYFEYRKFLEEAGVYFLENDSAYFEFGNMRVRLTGIELPISTYEKFKKVPVSTEDIEKLVGPSDRNCFQVLLAHNPGYFKVYREWGANLVLSGHFHGGIMRIPGWRGVITPQAFLFPKYSGEMTTEGDSTIVVSKGLGTHTIHFRVFNHPEVVVLHLHR